MCLKCGSNVIVESNLYSYILLQEQSFKVCNFVNNDFHRKLIMISSNEKKSSKVALTEVIWGSADKELVGKRNVKALHETLKIKYKNYRYSRFFHNSYKVGIVADFGIKGFFQQQKNNVASSGTQSHYGWFKGSMLNLLS